jgi:hypothetical protein
MLEHAFGRLECMRVEFKTDARNERSRAALAALPAQFEGVFRKHMLIPGVGVRDSAYYSVIDEDWPDVRAHLKRRLTAARARPCSAHNNGYTHYKSHIHNSALFIHLRTPSTR